MAVEDMLSDIRREAAEHTNEIVKEGIKGDYNTQGSVKDARFDVNSRISGLQAEMDSRFYSVGRDTQDIRAQIVAQQQQIVAGFLGVSKDTEISALKTQAELAKQSVYLSDKIDADGEKTRALINDLKTQDLNRMLIERNAEIVEERSDRRHWRNSAEQNQWAALQSQIQAFGSQLSDARNSMVNFGTQLGVGQRATSNNVN
jgi:ABC-type uncharacterized transport system ATPase component